MEDMNFTVEETQEYKRQLEEWKDKYFGAVFITEINDTAYIWRGLSKAEFNKANEYFSDDYDRAEFVCRSCVLYPEIDDFSIDMHAGVPETLTEQILKESGFSLTIKELDNQIAQYERQMTFDNQITCVIKEAFPDIPFEEIENWQFQKVLWYYARAKWTLETLRGLTLEREDNNDVPGL